jgi:hypothetical protein
MTKKIIFNIIFLLIPINLLAADATSFNPTSVSITSQGIIPVGTVIAWSSTNNPVDMSKWLECNGQSIPINSQYDALRSILGSSTVPNYNDQFLRGTTITSQVGQQVTDSIRAHSHEIAPHQHTVSGSASGQAYSGSIGSQSVSGYASGQNYSGSIAGQHITGSTSGQSYTYNSAGSDSYSQMIGSMGAIPSYHDLVYNVYNNIAYGTTSGGTFDGYTATSYYSGTTSGGTVSGWTSGTSFSGTTSGGTITGYTNYAGGGTTHETGGSETAPVHTKVRYLIRAIL